MSLEPGQSIGHYRLDRKIGEGGMGIVYVAEDTRLGRRVALKILPPQMAADAGRRARFEREARAIAALNHPNIVTLHSVEEAGGVAFLTMELVDGRRLTELLEREGLPFRKFLEWALAIADALVAAHQQGVVHRDLKPDNIMITSEGRLKVLDFGLAKMRESATEPASTVVPTASVTEEGKILGTFSYMSPEQAQGKPLDHRSDIFSLGIVLYEMATGQRPFQGDTAISTISSILKDTPTPPGTINTSLPEHAARVIRRCLAKEPERRYQSTEDLRNELRELKEDSESGERTAEQVAAPVVAESPAGSGRSRRALPAAVGALVVVAALAAWLGLRGGAAKPPEITMQSILRMSRATVDGKVAEVAISPDGRYLAYVRRERSIYSLQLRQVATGDEVQVVAPDGSPLGFPSFTADGDFLHYVQSEPGRTTGTVYRVSVLGGSPRRIVDGVWSVTASPDGKLLAGTGGNFEEAHVTVMGVDGGSPRGIATRKGSDHFDSGAEWSPDSGSVAVVSHRMGEPQQIVRIDPGSGREEPLAIPGLRSFLDLCWLPGGGALLLAGSERPANQGGSPQIWQVSLAGQLQPLTRDLNSYVDLSVTADGSTIAAVQVERRSGIAIAPVRDGAPGPFEEIFPVSPLRAGMRGIAWLGTDRLAYSGVQAEFDQVFVTDITSKSSRALTSGPSHHDPAASRDGRTLVVMRDEGTRGNLWRVDPETGGAQQLTSGEYEGWQTLTSDGASVLYIAAGDPLRLMKTSSSGGAPALMMERPMDCQDISPDDREAVCLLYNNEGNPEPVIFPLDGGEPRPIPHLPPAASEIRYGPDGRSLTYLLASQGADELWSLPLAGGEARRLVRFDDERVGDFAWSPDGRRLAVVKYVESGDVVLLKRGPS